jgi:drug/metabolite transporter (DMT)-like permease
MAQCAGLSTGEPSVTAAVRTSIAIAAALGAAASFAVANVAQARAARRARGGQHFSPTLLLGLLRNKIWVLGLVVSAMGFALQAVALSLAPVLLVQPLIVTELLFALPLAAARAGVRLRTRDYAGAALVAGGLAIFALVAHPAGNRLETSAGNWLLIVVAVTVPVAALTALAERRLASGTLRTTTLAAAAGICFGLLSALTKTVTHQFGDDGISALTRAQPWLLAVVALTGLTLTQTAFRSGPVAVSLPMIDIGEPVVASLIAMLAFGEHIARGPGVAAGAVVSALIVAVGIITLDTSPSVRAAQGSLIEAST